METVETSCPRGANADRSECEVEADADRRTCTVTILDQSWLGPKKVQEASCVDAEDDEDNHHDLGESGGELILALTEEEDDQEDRSGSRNRKELISWTAL